jgi:hypothetical protein
VGGSHLLQGMAHFSEIFQKHAFKGLLVMGQKHFFGMVIGVEVDPAE